MKVFRNRYVSRLLTLFTGILFLNMGFFLAEMNMLGFTDRQMIENVAKLVLNGGLEEERDAHSGGDTPVKLFSLGNELLMRHASLFLIASRHFFDSRENYLHANHSQKVSQPPEFTGRFS